MEHTYDDNTYSDLHKDVYGFRPRSDNFYNSTPDEKQAMWDFLLSSLEDVMAEEKVMQEKAIQEYEAEIVRNMSLGAPDRETAIKWIVQALEPSEMDYAYGGEYFCFELGLPYNYASELNVEVV
jgi:hypothetical protein